MKKVGKSLRSTYWKLHNKEKMLVVRLKGYLGGSPPKICIHTVLAMPAVFAALALYTSSKAVCDIDRNDGDQIVTDHVGQVEPSVRSDDNHNVTPCLYGIDEG